MDSLASRCDVPSFRDFIPESCSILVLLADPAFRHLLHPMRSNGIEHQGQRMLINILRVPSGSSPGSRYRGRGRLYFISICFLYYYISTIPITTAETITVQVGRRGPALALKFTPEEIVAKPGDQIEFQFYPLVCLPFPIFLRPHKNNLPYPHCSSSHPTKGPPSIYRYLC
jgi:hypothetical protein